MRWILALGCALTVSGLARAEVDTMTFDAEGLSELDLRNDMGNVTIGVSDSGEATVASNQAESDDDCFLFIEQTDSTLSVEVMHEPGSRSQESCREVDFDITLPREVALNLKSGSGQVKVSGTKGPITYEAGSGHLSFDAEITALDGKSGSGTIDVIGLTAGGAIRLGSGQITLTYRQPPSPGSLDINLGSGNIAVTMPAGSQVNTTFKTGSGRLTSEIGANPDACFSINAVAGSGNMTIKNSD
jgi:DUF4097 and DUF4098 domain-containing protein YvlB